MTLSAAISPAIAPVKTTATATPIRMTPVAAAPAVTTPSKTTANVGPTAVMTPVRTSTVVAQSVTQADVAPSVSPAQAAAAASSVMRPSAAVQTAMAPAATTTQVTLTPRPQAAAASTVAQPAAPNRIDPMATNTVFQTGPTSTPLVKLTPAQPAQSTPQPMSTILIKPSAPAPTTQTPAQQSATVATATQAVKQAATPAPLPPSLQPQNMPAQANSGTGAQVKPGNPNANTGVVGPTAQSPALAPLNDLQRVRAALVAWLNDAMVYATMDPDARLAAKSAIMSNPDSSVVAKTLAALVTASTPQKANDQGTSVIIIPDDTFAGYLGAFTLAKRLLALPESVNSPSAKTITNSIPALQALINLIDLALAGQALPTDIPAALKDDGPFYTKWWFWSLVGLVGIGGAAYVAHKRH